MDQVVSFDKDTYWKRRKHVTVTRNDEGEITSAVPSPLRGQTDTLTKPTIAKWTEQDLERGKCNADQVGKERTSGIKYMMIGTTPVPANRAKRRLRSVNRKFTKKGYRYGVEIVK